MKIFEILQEVKVHHPALLSLSLSLCVCVCVCCVPRALCSSPLLPVLCWLQATQVQHTLKDEAFDTCQIRTSLGSLPAEFQKFSQNGRRNRAKSQPILTIGAGAGAGTGTGVDLRSWVLLNSTSSSLRYLLIFYA